jgi:hypothetical protein
MTAGGIWTGLIEATSNRGFCAGVCDAACMTGIANVINKRTFFIILRQSGANQSDSEVRVVERKKHLCRRQQHSHVRAEQFWPKRCQSNETFTRLLSTLYRQSYCGYSVVLEEQMKNVWLGMFMALAVEAHAASAVDGKWESHLPNPQGGQLIVVFDLNSDGSAVAGTVTNSNGTAQLHKVFVQDGKVQGETVNFAIFYPLPFLSNRYGLREMVGLIRGWGAPLNKITGTVSSDSIAFIQRDWKGDILQFKAVRVK